MNKVKLTQAQVDAINEALDNFGTAWHLVKFHESLVDKGAKWTTWTALNDLTPYKLACALDYGYEVVEQLSTQPSVSEKGKETPHLDMRSYYGTPVRVLKGEHQGRVLPITFIRSDSRVFEIGGEILLYIKDSGDWWTFADGEQSSPQVTQNHPQCRHVVASVELQTDDKTDLAPHDYSSVIDLALATGDKAWFDELHAKMREGAIQ